MKVRISKASISFFYTDAMVICDKHEQDDKYYKHSPVIIVEVLSESTRKHDLTTKKLCILSKFQGNINKLERI
jgi:Uma2 family endonuclease